MASQASAGGAGVRLLGLQAWRVLEMGYIRSEGRKAAMSRHLPARVDLLV